MRSMCVDCGLGAYFEAFADKWSKHRVIFNYNSTNNEKNGGSPLSRNWESMITDPPEHSASAYHFEIISFVFTGSLPLSPLELALN